MVDRCLRLHTPFLRIADVRSEFADRVMNDLRPQVEEAYPVLQQHGVEKAFWTRLEDRLSFNLQRMLAQPGDCVGVLCAQSIGERQTQLTLNSFHSAGLSVQTVVTGVPRFLELLNATRELKTSATQFSLRDSDGLTPTEMRLKMAHAVVHVRMHDLIESFQTVRFLTDACWWWEHAMLFSKDDNLAQNEGHVCCTLRFRRNILYQNRLSMRLIERIIRDKFTDALVLASPVWVGEMTIVLPATLMQEIVSIRPPESQEHKETTSHYSLAANFVKSVFLPELLDLHVVGLPGVQQINVQKRTDGGFCIETIGACFKGLAGSDLVDFPTLRTNRTWDIYDTLGVEACREFLVQEFGHIVSSDGSFVHPSHVHLLVDMMTRHGTITSISRYGMKKESTGPLSRASFEEVMDHFLTASVFEENENLTGVSASIICGKRAGLGTGLCDLSMKLPV